MSSLLSYLRWGRVERESFCLLFALIAATIPVITHAYAPITFRHQHHLFTIDPDHYRWQGEVEQWTYRGRPIQPRPEWRVDGDTVPTLPAGVERATVTDWDRHAMARTFQKRIAAAIDREAGAVQIARNASGAIVFDGLGMLGRSVNLPELVTLTIAAIDAEVTDVIIPMTEIQPEIILADAELEQRGIREVVAVGESNFAGSPLNRQHNIAVGLEKFNGIVVPQGETFSFNDNLGPVNGATGFKKELVILGEKTLPEYGGGLCQVSTTAYRGVWEYGFPIEQRRNHSFAVGYYGPQGTDATIYPPHTDMKFLNDSPSDILIQTHTDGENAYFIYYGSRDNRVAEIMGPYQWGHQSPPPQRTEYTTTLAPGQRKKVGSAVPGLKTAWFRVLKDPDDTEAEDPVVERYYSAYQARPLFYQVGIASEPEAPAIPEPPSWLQPTPTQPAPPVSQPGPRTTEPPPVARNYYRPSVRSLRR